MSISQDKQDLTIHRFVNNYFNIFLAVFEGKGFDECGLHIN